MNIVFNEDLRVVSALRAVRYTVDNRTPALRWSNHKKARLRLNSVGDLGFQIYQGLLQNLTGSGWIIMRNR